MPFLPSKIALGKTAIKYGIKLILMFGSQVNKKTHQMSDIDIGVLLKKNDLDFDKHMALLADFQKLFPSKRVDLVIINQADPLFLKKILESCKLLFGKEDELNKLKLYSFHQFCDYQKYFKLEEEFANRFIKTLK